MVTGERDAARGGEALQSADKTWRALIGKLEILGAGEWLPFPQAHPERFGSGAGFSFFFAFTLTGGEDLVAP